MFASAGVGLSRWKKEASYQRAQKLGEGAAAGRGPRWANVARSAGWERERDWVRARLAEARSQRRKQRSISDLED